MKGKTDSPKEEQAPAVVSILIFLWIWFSLFIFFYNNNNKKKKEELAEDISSKLMESSESIPASKDDIDTVNLQFEDFEIFDQQIGR